MQPPKKIFAIIGSASKNSANLKLVEHIAEQTRDVFTITIFDTLSELPHFSPELSIDGTPEIILNLRQTIADSDGVLICTPEYVFSIPSGLKNAIEWCVSTTVFSGKPVGLVTASAHGVKAQEELKLIMRTIEASFTEETCLLIQGVKGKINASGELTDVKTKEEVERFVKSFTELIRK